jgi:hypothetical protein
LDKKAKRKKWIKRLSQEEELKIQNAVYTLEILSESDNEHDSTTI